MKKNWEKIEWLLFLMAVILVVLLSVLFMYFEGLMIGGGGNITTLALALLNQILPNLIASLIIVIFIYIFLKSKGIDSDEQYRDRLVNIIIDRIKTEISPQNIDSLVEKIASYKNEKFIRLEYSKEKFRFSEKLKVANSIWINGYSCAPLFREFKSEIERSLLNGTNIRLIITEPHSVAARMMEERDVHAERVVADINYVKSEIAVIRDALTKSKNKKLGHFDVKFIDWLPSCSMILYNPEEEDGEVKIKVYPPFYSTNHFNPIEMIIDKKSYRDQFDYFVAQYNRLWTKEVGQNQDVRTGQTRQPSAEE
jgi:uncharacterized membrane protein